MLIIILIVIIIFQWYRNNSIIKRKNDAHDLELVKFDALIQHYKSNIEAFERDKHDINEAHRLNKMRGEQLADLRIQKYINEEISNELKESKRENENLIEILILLIN